MRDRPGNKHAVVGVRAQFCVMQYTCNGRYVAGEQMGPRRSLQSLESDKIMYICTRDDEQRVS